MYFYEFLYPQKNIDSMIPIAKSSATSRINVFMLKDRNESCKTNAKLLLVINRFMFIELSFACLLKVWQTAYKTETVNIQPLHCFRESDNIKKKKSRKSRGGKVEGETEEKSKNDSIFA